MNHFISPLPWKRGDYSFAFRPSICPSVSFRPTKCVAHSSEKTINATAMKLIQFPDQNCLEKFD